MSSSSDQSPLRIIGKNDRICIITDCEPDDYLAMLALLKFLRSKPNEIIIIVSAWQKQRPKAAKLCSFLEKEFPDMLDRITIKLGEPSDANYEMVLTPEEELMIFESYTILDLEVEIIFQLTHPVEIWKAYSDNFVMFENTSLFTYGSFNYRHLIYNGTLVEADIIKLFASFGFVFYYEAFPATNPTTMEYDDLTELLHQNYPHIAKMINWWNQRIYDECKQNTVTLTDPQAMERNQKIVDSIRRYPIQFLDADGGMMATLLLPQSKYAIGRLVWPAGSYPSFDEIGKGVNLCGLFPESICYPDVTDKAANHALHHQFYVDLLTK
jgi:hypothetical protein